MTSKAKRQRKAAVDVPWFVFYGTLTTVIWAPTERIAFDRLCAALFPRRHDGSRLALPSPSEVTIRPPRPADHRWVDQEDDRRFAAALEWLDHRARA